MWVSVCVCVCAFVRACVRRWISFSFPVCIITGHRDAIRKERPGTLELELIQVDRAIRSSLNDLLVLQVANFIDRRHVRCCYGWIKRRPTTHFLLRCYGEYFRKNRFLPGEVTVSICILWYRMVNGFLLLEGGTRIDWRRFNRHFDNFEKIIVNVTSTHV